MAPAFCQSRSACAAACAVAGAVGANAVPGFANVNRIIISLSLRLSQREPSLGAQRGTAQAICFGAKCERFSHFRGAMATRIPAMQALRAFDAAARERSLTHAANALHVTHGA